MALGPAGTTELAGMEGHDPAGFIRPSGTGTYVIGYRSEPSRIELEADRFESYLREEGLETVIQKRASRGESRAPGREVYSRCAKAILEVGEGPFEGAGRALGFPLEIVPEADSIGSTRPVSFRILDRGTPLPGALVVAILRGDEGSPLSARSDHEGLVSFDLTRAGIWLIKTVRMVEAKPDDGADWESLWASLTLDRGPQER
jgi:hypothetical protein